MTRLTILTVATAAILVADVHAAPAAEPNADEEQRLVEVLESDRPFTEKCTACDRLKRIGTARSVPALAGLLTDERLTDWARTALESMPCPEAGAALRQAMAKTAGRARAGIVHSLGRRQDAQAVDILVPLLGNEDTEVAAAAAMALGDIGGAKPEATLKDAAGRAQPPTRIAVFDALLACAERHLAAGEKPRAAAIYTDLEDASHPEYVRVAAFRGRILGGGDGAAALLEQALEGTDRARRTAALGLVQSNPHHVPTATVAALLGRVGPSVRVALLGTLAERGDRSAVPAVASAAKSVAGPVRTAALRALGSLGDASVIAVLADAAANAEEDEQEAAREALVRLRGPKVRATLLERAASAGPAVREELIGALARRGERQAVPALFAMARAEDAAVRAPAVRALAVLAGDDAVGDLVGLLVRVGSEHERQALERAVRSVGERSERPAALVPAVLAPEKRAGTGARCALLRVAGHLGGPEALVALRTAVRHPSAEVRDTAVRTLADVAGPEAAPDLLRLAREAKDETHRVLALRGYWRMLGEATGLPATERLRLVREGLEVARRPDDRKRALSVLAHVPHLEALALAVDLAAEGAIRPEAHAACVLIASALGGQHPAAARAALRKVVDETGDDALRTQATEALAALDRFRGYITGWEAAGPYRQAGKECTALFDIAFPPEQPAAKGVTWQPAPTPADPALFWQADLSSLVGGNHCVMYLRARVRSPKAQPVRLGIGTDDGVKVWVNGRLVHANNAIRGLTPGQDKADAELKQGANTFLMKITQHTLGCGACVRLCRPDGSPVEDLSFGPGPE
jgi:HEAT repeat protein